MYHVTTTEDEHGRLHSTVRAMSEAVKVDLSWSAYPVGTVAHSVDGGYWTRTADGWKANGGDTFPTPGADAVSVTLRSAGVRGAREGEGVRSE